MPDYYTQTVVQQPIPFAEMTSLEKLVLSGIFDTESENGALHCFSCENLNITPSFDLAEMRDCLKHADGIPSRLHDLVATEIAKTLAGAETIDLDLSVAGYEFILQDILKRSQMLTHISITAAFTCTKMRPDGFGGMVTLITTEEILSTSTDEILEKWLRDEFA